MSAALCVFEKLIIRLSRVGRSPFRVRYGGANKKQPACTFAHQFSTVDVSVKDRVQIAKLTCHFQRINAPQMTPFDVDAKRIEAEKMPVNRQ